MEVLETDGLEVYNIEHKLKIPFKTTLYAQTLKTQKMGIMKKWKTNCKKFHSISIFLHTTQACNLTWIKIALSLLPQQTGHDETLSKKNKKQLSSSPVLSS